jgi:hypothetical protein
MDKPAKSHQAEYFTSDDIKPFPALVVSNQSLGCGTKPDLLHLHTFFVHISMLVSWYIGSSHIGSPLDAYNERKVMHYTLGLSVKSACLWGLV